MDDLKGRITGYFGSEQKYPSAAIVSKRGTAPYVRVHFFSAGGVIVGEMVYCLWIQDILQKSELEVECIYYLMREHELQEILF